MKKLLLVFALTLSTSLAFSQTLVGLDDAIQNGAQEIESRLERGVKVVVLNFNSPSTRFSNYVLDELTAALVNSGRLVVVDRQNLELIQQEMNFQMSGEVSDTSAQEIGMKLGAQSIISGSLEDLGNSYRIRFRAIEVVSAAIQAVPQANIRKDTRTNALLAGAAGTSPSTQTSMTTYPNGLNFSTGRKVGAGFLNIVYGLGSFTMGDWVGGLIVGGAELVGVLCVINGNTTTYDTYGNGGSEPTTAFYFGMVLEVGAVVYGFIRPFQYDTALARKNGTYYAAIEDKNPLYHMSVGLVNSGGDGLDTVNLSFRYHY
ncbi:MAG: CsgG/HfaB family protein [Spirochaetaceae bacterium]|nr:CsgG/HfaB family protein [Spirochaetaceae bacterium]